MITRLTGRHLALTHKLQLYVYPSLMLVACFFYLSMTVLAPLSSRSASHVTRSILVLVATMMELLTLMDVLKLIHSFYFFHVFSSVLASIEKIHQTLETVFDHISKHLEVRQKHSAACRIFNSPLGVWKCGQTRSFVFDILRFI